MTRPYAFQDDHSFVIEQYNDQPAFASFLPGIAGAQGHPAWVFYVNRGQAIASFGIRNKDGAFLEFFPADKAYQLTASRGFRTFVKIHDSDGTITHEPFQRGAQRHVQQRMRIQAHEVGVEEVNPELELCFRAEVFTLPQTPVAALIRRVEITNTSNHPKHLEIADGLPQVLPYGLNQWLVKFMSRTSEAFIRTEFADADLPFYRLKVWPTDSPQTEPIEAGHFFAGFSGNQRNPVIVDACKIFGLAGDFSRAEGFFAHDTLDLSDQITGNQTPSAFQRVTMTLQPGESQVFYGVYGHAASQEILTAFIQSINGAAYFEQHRQLNRQIVDELVKPAFCTTTLPLFDAHTRQCFLDNGLRGGFSQTVPGGAQLYLFGRKHGDLERDYNDFLLLDSPYSEGNGDFRDMLQNRRVDVLFNPSIGDKNIRYFFNLIQPDGYNPCSLRNSRYRVENPQRFADYFAAFPGLQALLNSEFKYAELWQLVGQSPSSASLLTNILAQAQEVEDAEFDRGYWSDHWTYLLDLLISYRAVYPERVDGLLHDESFHFFDPTHRILPRRHKYHVTPHGIRQYDSVQTSKDKIRLIEARTQRRYQVRDQHGHGAIVQCSLLGKILTLIANKLATLDPFGVGIEMEADRPGWCDALNGLPGILGSSVNETIELKRLIDFTRQALANDTTEVSLPGELTEFILALHDLLQQQPAPLAFWQASGDLKEAYREQVFMGFAGTQLNLSVNELKVFLHSAERHVAQAIDRAYSEQGIDTYFAYSAEHVEESADGVSVLSFKQQRLPLFLEGFVHALRIADPAKAQTLYQAVHDSVLYDQKLGMYRLNTPLGEQALDLGRIGVFHYGWLENGSIFLHMHYKFVLEMLRTGLVDAFYRDMPQLLVAFHDPQVYGRNPLENSSFLVSSGFSVDPKQHGRGCVARLSGSTVEFLHLWLHLMLGPQPFVYQNGQLSFQPSPLLNAALFSEQPQTVCPFGLDEPLPANSLACALFGNTLLVYENPQRLNSYGAEAVTPKQFRLYGRDGREQTQETLTGEQAEQLRNGQFRRVDVLLQ